MKLLPCPFCGENEQEIWYHKIHEWDEQVSIRCEHCGVIGEPCNTRQQAREAWNTRAELTESMKQKVAEYLQCEADARKDVEENR